MNSKANTYTGNRNFLDIDEFKAPKLSFNEKREYTELENKKFRTLNGEAEIAKAIQTIKFTIDEKGGEVKSEAIIDVKETTAVFDPNPVVNEPRYFYVDDTFAIFLREKGKELPYFSARVDDITKFQ